MVLTKSNTFIIGQAATLLGFIINGLYMFMHGTFGIANIALCIILFTIVVNILMLPLTIRQQKSSRMTAVMNPELQAITKKYKNKKDNESMMKMQQEQQAVYAKYGVSPMGTCLPLLIQMPILFAMYQVIWKIPAYVSSVKSIYLGLVEKLMVTDGAQAFLEQFATQARVNFEKIGFNENSIVDVLYNLKPANWTELADKFPDLKSLIETTAASTEHVNSFIGINIADSPMSIIRSSWSEKAIVPIIIALAIPVLAGLTQYLSVKLMPQTAPQAEGDESAVANSMKTMNTMMPLMSVFFCFTFSTGIGLYWVASSAVRSVIQFIINKRMANIDIDEMVKQNMEKYNEKRKKRGLPPESISGQARRNLKNLQNPAEESTENIQARTEKRLKNIKDSTEYYKNTSAKPGSIASKARMVQQYNEKNQKK
ncbi:MAG: YidC/Oxa1 family membrane protein insertase [Eubacteriales bacterium]|nr:YidC/Oxa1 family membrane protein insertase [Eubacteriales bacterium]